MIFALVFLMAVGSGAPQVFETGILLPPGQTVSGQFGHAVALTDRVSLVGDWPNDLVWVFDATSGKRLLLLEPDVDDFTQFGVSLDVEGSRAVVGAKRDDDLGTWAGAAYLFDLASGALLAKLHGSDGDFYDEFGSSVAISRRWILVGADREHGERGAAYVFDASTGTELQKIQAPDGVQYDRFGCSVAAWEHLAIIGALGDDDNGSNSGSAWVFDLRTGLPVVKLVDPQGQLGDRFGSAVAISRSRALVGAPDADLAGSLSGAAFVLNALTGEKLHTLLPPGLAADDRLGWSVALDGPLAFVGAPFDSAPSLYSGSAWAFDLRTGTTCVQLVNTKVAQQDSFGDGVAASNGRVLVGAIDDDDQAPGAGAVLVFEL